MEMTDRQQRWDKRYLKLAEFVAQWSKDPSTKTGAVLVSPKNFVVAVGYNGFPRGVEDTETRLNDRETKYKMIVHCERNAIISAAQDLAGFTLYTWPFMSCSPCAGMVAQSGITRAVAHKNDNPRWQADFKLTQEIFAEAGVKLDLYESETK
jgi:dCMP deaminase